MTDLESAIAEEIARFLPVTVASSKRARVLITGFGRFPRVADNASGHIACALVPGLKYPEREESDPFEPHLEWAKGAGIISMPNGTGRARDVDAVGMVLPVCWDFAAAIVRAQIDEMDPDLVLMMGVAAERQAMWLELGAQNKTNGNVDAAGRAPESETLIKSAPHAEALFFPWKRAIDAALGAIAQHGSTEHAGERFDSIVQGVKLAPFPRPTNAYLCNAVSFAVAHAMSAANQNSPRAFLHVPCALEGAHVENAAHVIRAMLGASLYADDSTFGDPAFAETVEGGEFY